MVLLRMGFAQHMTLPPCRWSLTPPFHPYLLTHKRRFIFCCTIHGVSPSGRYPASCPVKPGLSSHAYDPACATERTARRSRLVLTNAFEFFTQSPLLENTSQGVQTLRASILKNACGSFCVFQNKSRTSFSLYPCSNSPLLENTSQGVQTLRASILKNACGSFCVFQNKSRTSLKIPSSFFTFYTGKTLPPTNSLTIELCGISSLLTPIK